MYSSLTSTLNLVLRLVVPKVCVSKPVLCVLPCSVAQHGNLLFCSGYSMVQYGIVKFNVLFDTLQVTSGTIFPANHLISATMGFKPNQSATKSQHKN